MTNDACPQRWRCGCLAPFFFFLLTRAKTRIGWSNQSLEFVFSSAPNGIKYLYSSNCKSLHPYAHPPTHPPESGLLQLGPLSAEPLVLAAKAHRERFQHALAVLAKVRRGPAAEEAILLACQMVDRHLVRYCTIVLVLVFCAIESERRV